ncbi:MAG TPA: PHB depolymerase family esterase [Ktedonobacteraceae bacterium]|nr:PHB depolymerase family esterase [Ktedonobacteraceae bacterium]
MSPQLKRFALLCCMAVIFSCSLLFRFPSTARASGGTWQSFVFVSPAGNHPFFVYTPVNYHPGTPVPLMVMLHGCLQTPSDLAAGTQMDQLADQKQFIVVYPQQTATFNASSCWNWFLPADQIRGAGEPSVIAGITQFVEQTTSQWTIDARRVYVTGISAGAAMSVIMGATYPDIYAAIGVHSGTEYQASVSPLTAGSVLLFGGPNPSTQGRAALNAMGSHARVVPTIVFHGTSDTTVAPINGDQAVQQWMTTDKLASGGSYSASFGSPSSSINGQVSGGHSYRVRQWKDNGGNEVQEYWTVNGMGHAWSGGSSAGSFTDPQGPSATQAMYTFFINHPMP